MPPPPRSLRSVRQAGSQPPPARNCNCKRKRNRCCCLRRAPPGLPSHDSREVERAPSHVPPPPPLYNPPGPARPPLTCHATPTSHCGMICATMYGRPRRPPFFLNFHAIMPTVDESSRVESSELTPVWSK